MPKKNVTIMAIVLAAALVVVGGLYIRESMNHADTQAQLEQLSGTVLNLQTDLAGRVSEIEALNSDLEGKASEIAVLNTDLEGKASEIAALNSDLEGKASEIEALNTDLEGKTSEIAALNSDLEGKASEIEALNSDMKTAASMFRKMIDDLKGKETEIDTLNAKISGNDEIPDSIPGAYTATRKFLYGLEKEGIKYTYNGVDSDEDDRILISYTLDQGQNIDVNIWVTPDSEMITFRVWNVIRFDERSRASVLDACMELQSEYRFIQFVVWDEDNSVNAGYDLLIREEDRISETAVESLQYVVDIVEKSLPRLEPFAR